MHYEMAQMVACAMAKGTGDKVLLTSWLQSSLLFIVTQTVLLFTSRRKRFWGDFMEKIFFDFEFANDNCRHRKERTYADLIQVGYICSDNSNGEFFVKPHHPLSAEISALTGIQPKDVEHAMDIDSAVRKLLQLSNDKTVLFFGNYDKSVLLTNCNYLRSDKLKKLFAAFISKAKFVNGFGISLNDWGYIIGSKHKGTHSAKRDAILFRDVFYGRHKLNADAKKRKKEIEKYTKLKRDLGQMKNGFLDAKAAGYSLDDCIKFLRFIDKNGFETSYSAYKEMFNGVHQKSPTS